MKSLLDALQEGRLIELPDNNKNRALEYLAALIEAIPGVEVDGGVTENVLAREQAHNTGIGHGWACPHARARHDGELVCSVGWSPAGIDYGSPDNAPVHLMVMYFVPDAQKNAYLKEISSLAKAILTQPALKNLQSLTDLADVRNALLDAISIALESTAPEAKARMIQLEARHAAAGEIVTALPDALAHIIPLSIVAIPGTGAIVLCQDRDLVHLLESQAQLVQQLAQDGRATYPGFQLLLRSSSGYQPDRTVYECFAFKTGDKAG
jgi:mannitol/fructose-specific phosphotransferase system IIA component (Ntr-type)